MSLEDTFIRRQIFDLRFGNFAAEEAAEKLENIYAAIEARILREPDTMQSVRLAILRDDVDRILQQGFIELDEDITRTMLEFAGVEADFTYRAVNLDTNVVMLVPDEAAVNRLVTNIPMDAPAGAKPITMNEAINDFSTTKSREVRQTIEDGILSGSTSQQISNDVRDLARHRHRAQVEALVRTTTNHASSQARNAVSSANADLMKGEEWVATLDNRTTLICGGRDGRIYPIGRGPFPPAHWNCRSVRVPVLKDEFNLDDSGTRRPEKGAKGAGTTTGTTKFDGWLRRQPAGFQDEYFSQFTDGAEKAALFRRGGLGIQQFRSETGINYTLDQLASLEPQAFRLANIETP